MTVSRRHVVASIGAGLASGVTAVASDPKARINLDRFETLVTRVADGWNANDAAHAASAFSADAIYSEPPDKQLYVGREAIYRFFGGETGREYPMHMTWHHLSFNEKHQTGAGEFTFGWPDGQVHGMVSLRLTAGLISNWREYFYESDKNWQDFQGGNRF